MFTSMTTDANDAGVPVDVSLPRQAGDCLTRGELARAIELATTASRTWPELVSARVILAKALFATGQFEAASDQAHEALVRDPQNLAALKILGDISATAGDDAAALSYYHRVLELDPHTGGLRSDLRGPLSGTRRKLVMARAAEEQGKQAADRAASVNRRIPFYTETLGDLYLAQGYPHLAADVYGRVGEMTGESRLREKLELALQRVQERERRSLHGDNPPDAIQKETGAGTA